MLDLNWHLFRERYKFLKFLNFPKSCKQRNCTSFTRDGAEWSVAEGDGWRRSLAILLWKNTAWNGGPWHEKWKMVASKSDNILAWDCAWNQCKCKRFKKTRHKSRTPCCHPIMNHDIPNVVWSVRGDGHMWDKKSVETKYAMILRLHVTNPVTIGFISKVNRASRIKMCMCSMCVY